MTRGSRSIVCWCSAAPTACRPASIAQSLGLLPSSLTFHLQHLTHAGLISQRRLGRQLIYAADFTAMNALMAYLTENCCGGGAVCAPACCPQTPAIANEKQSA